MSQVKAWLAEVPWDLVIFQNASLCEQKNALHKPTSDGYETTKAFWVSTHQQPMTLMDAVDLCRRCHRMAPFCFYNGNTFAAIARSMVEQLGLSGSEAAALRSLAGHIVAGVATPEQQEAFRRFCERG
jgi:hypothetical protein|uniref:hypothetical protein n=1 Tax=Prosthecobacter sp. TaxID=1965333 RepID=UPI003784CDE0